MSLLLYATLLRCWPVISCFGLLYKLASLKMFDDLGKSFGLKQEEHISELI